MQATPTKYPARLRLGVMSVSFVITLAIFVYALVLAINWNTTPFIGVTLDHNGVVSAAIPADVSGWTGLEAGLQQHDRLLTIQRLPANTTVEEATTPIVPITDRLSVLGNMQPGDRINITLERPAMRGELVFDTSGSLICDPVRDGMATCNVTYAPASYPGNDFLGHFVVPYISGVVVLLIAGSVLVSRPADPNAFTVVISSLLLATFMATVFDSTTTHQLVPFWIIGGIMIGGVLITLGLTFPQPMPFVRRRPLLRFIPVVFFGVLAAYALFTYGEVESSTTGLIGVSVATGLSILAALLYFYQRKHAPTPTARNRANTVFLGVILGTSPTILWMLSRLFEWMAHNTNFPLAISAINFSIEAAMPFFITPVLGAAYAVLRRRHFNTDKAISQGFTYTIMFVALVIGYILLVLGATLMIGVEANNPLLVVLTIFIIAVLFVPVRARLQHRIDSIYYRKRLNFQDEMEAFSQKLTAQGSSDMLVDEFRTTLEKTIQPRTDFIFLLNAQTGQYEAYGKPHPETDVVFGLGSGVVNLLKNSDSIFYLQPDTPWPPELHIDRARLDILQVMVLAGLPGSEALNGFVCLGPPRSGENSYTFEELHFITNLTGQFAVAVERAQVIGSLEKRVRELDVLGAVGQAINFTADFNDLLELISTQTLRLIDAEYLYVVLHDTNTDYLYYAFFQEYDERDQEKENLRWPLGKDIYSEIIRNSQPQIVPDYTLTMAKRNYTTHYESHEIKAWMGVPLITGPNSNLGVLAVGSSNPDTRYGSDQLKIFSDIGALAATSIEKLRLFTETNDRARQLSVLNEIAGQLVATEGDVKRLLDLITTSAVDILKAEAGSLLLTVGEDDAELEFSAAVGGTGYELINTRIPAGHGIAGRVAQSGEAVIVNDISGSEAWKGEISQSEFHTSSILAVPLITKNKVIGVLEVINKRDGSVYVDGDVQLLTSFARQAAIALENARLLQQTDEALKRRVQELETLEMIDRELNRATDDIKKLAEITVRWAIANSGSTSGLLGIINDEGTHLRVMHRYGYEEDDIPEGADGDLWPLDRGITGRVMRTRRPDLQPDVTIDPDYTPSLQGALSQITVPMISGDEIIAILILETSREPRLNLIDQDWANRLAEHASIAISNYLLLSELTRANETKSEFVGFAAHELKNPLTSVKGYASTMSGPMASHLTPDKIQEFAGIIQRNAESMQSIIDDLRDIAASDANKLEIERSPISLRNVVVDTLIPYQSQIEEKEQTIIKNIAPDLPLMYADHQKMIQVMTNFVSNAHKYSPPGSTIVISGEVIERYINSKNQIVGDVLHIKVQDDGIGMSEEDLQRIFREDYFRSENELAREQKGTGLGMMITQRIIEAHNGEVWVASELGEGSTFQFVIPLAAKQSQTQEHEAMKSEPGSD